MSHNSTHIECDPREAEVIRSAHSFLCVIKLGRGKESRSTFENPKSFAYVAGRVEQTAAAAGRGASVYALGTAGGLEAAALYATYLPHNRTWKFAEQPAAEEGL